jgi:ribosome-associated toxin RatA of RatAB toxin-antitoxin module
MKRNFEVTRILPYKHTLVFEQIVDFERYQQYLPFCSASRLLNTDNKNFSQIGELEFAIAGVSYKIKSGNIIEDKRILITQIKGPFDEMKASWNVEQLDNDNSKISFKVNSKVPYFLGILLSGSTVEKFVNIFLDSFINDLDTKIKKETKAIR